MRIRERKNCHITHKKRVVCQQQTASLVGIAELEPMHKKVSEIDPIPSNDYWLLELTSLRCALLDEQLIAGFQMRFRIISDKT